MRQVQNFIREQKMIMPGDFVIAGVSGGADSVCLFFELLAYQKEISFSMEVVKTARIGTKSGISAASNVKHAGL